MTAYPQPELQVLKSLRKGTAIPAHPLALTSNRKLDERRQRALTRYYHAAGSGGVAVGVHTTQFAIREPKHDLYRPVLALAAETVAACDLKTGRLTVRVAGLCGTTQQAIGEAVLAREFGYHAGLLSLGALRNCSEPELIQHCDRVARELPLFGFYLQPAVGGRLLSRDFWRRFASIPNVVAIKIAPFNRYQTLEVLIGVLESGRAADIALYTGNDDNIVLDLLTTFQLKGRGASEPGELRIVGGLLGHWACWTSKAVALLHTLQNLRDHAALPQQLLTLAGQITDTNAALFDAHNNFAGCIPGIHEILRRQGLLEGTWCLDEHERLSPGQIQELDRVTEAYPHLLDDDFVQQHKDDWLSN
jgi:dihydrodipicolinate synthase/N-acetylneuraminate lyase